jgi:hypothetical protein
MNHRYLLTVLKLSLAAMVMAVLGASLAHAQEDAKIYPGLTCIKRFANAAIPVYNENGTIGNNSTTTLLHVGCPIVRDRFGEPEFSSLRRAWVQVIDRHPCQYIECRIINAYHSGGQTIIRYSFPRRSTEDVVGSDGVGGVELGWGDLPELRPTNSRTHYLLSCTIPAQSGSQPSQVVTYRAAEFLTTD